MAKFKVGDKVWVRPLLLGTEVDGLTVLYSHIEMQGIQTISHVDHSDSCYIIEGCAMWFSEGMLEKVEEEKKWKVNGLK